MRCLTILTTFSPPIITSALGNASHNLTLPLSPSDHFGYHLDGDLRNIQRYPPLKGGQLIYVLSTEAYKIWKLTGDGPIQRTEIDRIPPFERIQLSLEPTAVAPHHMSQVKLGISILLMMNRFFTDTRYWPAGFDFDITEFSPPIDIGSISVRQDLGGSIETFKELPENSTAQSLFGNAAKGLTVRTDSINPLSVRIDDRDWLYCISSMFWNAFTHSAESYLLSHFPRGRTLHFPVPGLVCDLATTHLMPTTFKWEQLTARLLLILRAWAVRDIWQDVEREEIRYGGEMVAYITIRPHQLLADDGEVATA